MFNNKIESATVLREFNEREGKYETKKDKAHIVSVVKVWLVDRESGEIINSFL